MTVPSQLGHLDSKCRVRREGPEDAGPETQPEKAPPAVIGTETGQQLQQRPSRNAPDTFVTKVAVGKPSGAVGRTRATP